MLRAKNKIGEESSLGSDTALVPAAISDAGCERELNEDRYAVIESPSGLAWLVCDGMGGVSGGELAAQLAIDSIRRDLENLAVRSPADAIRSAISEANRIIVLRRQNPAFAQMGTTIVATIFVAPQVILASAGDSRIYLISENSIKQMTVDHTYVQELVDRGQIKQEEALSHPDAHVLTRCIGAEPRLNIDLKTLWIWPCQEGEKGDTLLLCTDGLYSQVNEAEMVQIISQQEPQQACASLVEKAKQRGGFDNITLAIIPMGGMLKDQPPPGFKESHLMRRRQEQLDKKNAEAEKPGNVLKDLVILITLGVLAVIVAGLIFFLMLGSK
jgi:protein phosphatase